MSQKPIHVAYTQARHTISMSNQESESEFSLQDEQHEQAHEDGHEHDYDLKIDPEE